MSESDSDTSDSEIDACGSKFNPIKALYSNKTQIPVTSAPLYDNVSIFISAQAGKKTLAVGRHDLVAKRETEKMERKRLEQEKLEEIQKQRFKNVQVYTTVPKKVRTERDVIKKMEKMEGPLAALKECMNRRIRVKVVTRHATGIRGHLIGAVEAFDKQWNLAMSDVLEVWYRKKKTKRKIPPSLGAQLPSGSATALYKVPSVSETPMKKGVVECSRYLPQMLVRGEHIVLVSILEGV